MAPDPAVPGPDPAARVRDRVHSSVPGGVAERVGHVAAETRPSRRSGTPSRSTSPASATCAPASSPASSPGHLRGPRARRLPPHAQLHGGRGPHLARRREALQGARHVREHPRRRARRGRVRRRRRWGRRRRERGRRRHGRPQVRAGVRAVPAGRVSGGHLLRPGVSGSGRVQFWAYASSCSCCEKGKAKLYMGTSLLSSRSRLVALHRSDFDDKRSCFHGLYYSRSHMEISYSAYNQFLVSY